MITISGTRRYFAAKLRHSMTKDSVVSAGTDGLAAGTLQATLQALATRIAALET